MYVSRDVGCGMWGDVFSFLSFFLHFLSKFSLAIISCFDLINCFCLVSNLFSSNSSSTLSYFSSSTSFISFSSFSFRISLITPKQIWTQIWLHFVVIQADWFAHCTFVIEFLVLCLCLFWEVKIKKKKRQTK